MKKLIYFLCFLFWGSGEVTALSASSLPSPSAFPLKSLPDGGDFKIGNFFSPSGGVSMEEIMFSVKDDMNDRGAVKVHVVIVYERELVGEFARMSSRHYFEYIDQLVKDHPDKIKIFEWELVAKKRVTPWIRVEYPSDHLVPLAGYIFAKYSSSGEHRVKIPQTYKKVKVIFERKNFRIDFEDRDDE